MTGSGKLPGGAGVLYIMKVLVVMVTGDMLLSKLAKPHSECGCTLQKTICTRSWFLTTQQHTSTCKQLKTASERVGHTDVGLLASPYKRAAPGFPGSTVKMVEWSYGLLQLKRHKILEKSYASSRSPYPRLYNQSCATYYVRFSPVPKWTIIVSLYY